MLPKTCWSLNNGIIKVVFMFSVNEERVACNKCKQRAIEGLALELTNIFVKIIMDRIYIKILFSVILFRLFCMCVSSTVWSVVK